MQNILKSSEHPITVVEMPKSGGVQQSRFDEIGSMPLGGGTTIIGTDVGSGSASAAVQMIYESLALQYQEYFRGRHYLAFSKLDPTKLATLDPELLLLRNEYDP